MNTSGFTEEQFFFLVLHLPQFEQTRGTPVERTALLDLAEKFILRWPPSTELPLEKYEETGTNIMRVSQIEYKLNFVHLRIFV